MDRDGSRSRRLWESPLITTERYERRACLCRIRCTCRSSDFFTFRQKRIRDWTAFAEGNTGPLKRHLLLARTYHCLSVTHGYILHNTVQLAKHTLCCTLNWTAGGRQAGGKAGKKRGMMDDGKEGARGGWGREGAREGSEESMMRGRQGAGVEEGREG